MKIKIAFSLSIGLLLITLSPRPAQAWGKRGHQIVAETAALLNGGTPETLFMRERSFDFGYYANVPDFIWKREATYGFEGPQHYMNLEVFDRAFAKQPDVKDPLTLERKEFEEKFPEIKRENGRAFWRIRELYRDLEKVTVQLRELKEPTGSARQKLQEQWLVRAGTLAHYVGDLSMPLHVTENHDGAMTQQKGIHGYYEEVVVDHLFPEIGIAVNREATKQWPAFRKKNQDKTVLQLLLQLTGHSKKFIVPLLSIDKKSDRKNLAKVAAQYKNMIREQLIDSSLTLGELYRRQLGWNFDSKRFYFMAGEPVYIMPDAGAAAPPLPK